MGSSRAARSAGQTANATTARQRSEDREHRRLRDELSGALLASRIVAADFHGGTLCAGLRNIGSSRDAWPLQLLDEPRLSEMNTAKVRFAD